jgi:hypothetical protein
MTKNSMILAPQTVIVDPVRWKEHYVFLLTQIDASVIATPDGTFATEDYWLKRCNGMVVFSHGPKPEGVDALDFDFIYQHCAVKFGLKAYAEHGKWDYRGEWRMTGRKDAESGAVEYASTKNFGALWLTPEQLGIYLEEHMWEEVKF